MPQKFALPRRKCHAAYSHTSLDCRQCRVSAKIAWLHRPLFDVFIPFVGMSDVAAISSVFDRYPGLATRTLKPVAELRRHPGDHRFPPPFADLGKGCADPAGNEPVIHEFPLLRCRYVARLAARAHSRRPMVASPTARCCNSAWQARAAAARPMSGWKYAEPWSSSITVIVPPSLSTRRAAGLVDVSGAPGSLVAPVMRASRAGRDQFRRRSQPAGYGRGRRAWSWRG